MAKKEEAKTSWSGIPLVFTQDDNQQCCYITQHFSTSVKDRSTLKSQGHFYHHHHHHQNWPCSPGLSGPHIRVCLQLTDTPSLARQVLKEGGDLLTQLPVTPFPMWTWQATVVSDVTSSPHGRPCQWARFLWSCRFIKQLGSKISELREMSHRNFIHFSYFYSLFNTYNLSVFFHLISMHCSVLLLGEWPTVKVSAAKELTF